MSSEVELEKEEDLVGTHFKTSGKIVSGQAGAIIFQETLILFPLRIHLDSVDLRESIMLAILFSIGPNLPRFLSVNYPQFNEYEDKLLFWDFDDLLTFFCWQ